MASITMWRRGNRRCVLLVANGQFNLHIVEGEAIVQQQRARSADSAVMLAAIWEQTHADGQTQGDRQERLSTPSAEPTGIA